MTSTSLDYWIELCKFFDPSENYNRRLFLEWSLILTKSVQYEMKRTDWYFRTSVWDNCSHRFSLWNLIHKQEFTWHLIEIERKFNIRSTNHRSERPQISNLIDFDWSNKKNPRFTSVCRVHQTYRIYYFYITGNSSYIYTIII